jgi:hypothetical protein
MMLMLAGASVNGIDTAQTRRPPQKPVPKKPASVTRTKGPADVTCPAELGTGVRTKAKFCDVLIGSDPAGGIVVKIPPHRGTATLSFHLHNRHTYSEEDVKAKRAFARRTAAVFVVAPDGTIVDRALVQNEFRTAADLVDRIGGGAGPGKAKAVAPTGAQPITIAIPDGLETVSILGQKLTTERLEGTTTNTTAGRAIAIVSNVALEYTPAPAPRKRR